MPLPVIVGPHQWVDCREAGHVEVILDDHDVSHVEVLVDPSRGICHEQDLDPHQLHHSHRQDDLHTNIKTYYSRISISRTRLSRILEVRSVYLNQKYILIAFSNHNLASETFLQVQITRSAN